MITIKAISLWQPWATAWVLGLKRGETRHWAPMLKGAIYRGPVAVHAALTERDPETREPIRAWFERRLETCRQSREAFARAGIRQWPDLPRGAMLGLCTLDDVRPSILCGPHTSLEASWGDYSTGRFIWLPANMTAFKTPIPCKGRQGLFNWEVPAELFADEQFARILGRSAGRIRVQRFWLQETKSFPEGAPQRENFDSDEDFERICALYAEEWRATYECGDANCRSLDCPQHGPQLSLPGVRTAGVQAECTPQVRALGADAHASAATTGATVAK